ncbi:conserved hypothetical protein [Theileria equi strain WA]|uniref:DUF19 domain-containing protein n=1 Tax=Theileria equi strain WA TaxID=1537102 RepID=L1LBZ3_THEEQ|nr:conserved hypothetical protein [Theileria equi strain WA]EKX72967.1 conserved hypothetical protein [Theileria equi strain WA]|eukprot:XP_004832419.1 conserved hypothetical protein [Theileria equi strain WA]
MIFVLVWFLFFAKISDGNILHSNSNTLSGICHDLVQSFEILNKNELLKLVDINKCQDYELLGEKVLNISNKESNYCYKTAELILCNIKYKPYEANFNCEHIRDKFFQIVNKCTNDKESTENNCSNVNLESLFISDPLEFCRSNFIVLDGGKQIGFEDVEHDYCVRIVDNFNICQSVAKKMNHKKFCLDGGFQSYCSHYIKGMENIVNSYIAEIHDDTYETMCKNFVLPFVFSKLIESPETFSPNICKDSDNDISASILKKRDDIMYKSQSYTDCMDSELAYKYWVQDTESKMDKMAIGLQDIVKHSNLCFNYMIYCYSWSYGFDDLVKTEFGKGIKMVQGIFDQSVRLPQYQNNITKLIAEMDTLFLLERKIQETVVHFKQLYSLVTSGAHYFITFRYNSEQDRIAIGKARQTLARINTLFPQRVSMIKRALNTKEPFYSNISKANELHEKANHLKFIAELHEAQLSALRKIIAKTKDSNFLQSIKLS